MNPSEEQDEQQPPPDDSHLAPDRHLEFLVQLANAHGVEVTLILTLPGQIITGMLVSGQKYFATLARTVQDGEEDESAQGMMAHYLRSIATGYEKDFVEDRRAAEGVARARANGEDVDPPELPGVGFIHLLDASLVGPLGVPRPIGTWRGRLSEIVGWTFGTFRPSD